MNVRTIPIAGVLRGATFASRITQLGDYLLTKLRTTPHPRAISGLSGNRANFAETAETYEAEAAKDTEGR